MRRDQRSSEAEAFRPLYKTARWRRLRHQVFLRDLYRCRMCGRLQGDTSQLTCDHIVPHKGDMGLFWDQANLQTLCSDPCHIKHKQQAERIGYSTEVGDDGLPLDPLHPANR
jgi:5-methylcytosine-specific restriction protein A